MQHRRTFEQEQEWAHGHIQCWNPQELQYETQPHSLENPVTYVTLWGVHGAKVSISWPCYLINKPINCNTDHTTGLNMIVILPWHDTIRVTSQLFNTDTLSLIVQPFDNRSKLRRVRQYSDHNQYSGRIIRSIITPLLRDVLNVINHFAIASLLCNLVSSVGIAPTEQ